MVFSSLDFIVRFLPIFLLVYYVTPYKFKNFVLLVGSLYFYAFGEPVYIGVLAVAILLNYLISLVIKGKKAWLTLAVLLDVGMLIGFKYVHVLPDVNIGMPIGISFYTFQIISYMVDVYKGKARVQRSLIKFATYICMFPQLIVGPIVYYSEVEYDLSFRKHTLEKMEEGLKLFIIGLASKVLLADKFGILWNEVQTIGFESISTPLAWLGAFAFSFQIYFDFKGYSLMARGLGFMVGFSLPENFNNPYMSKSVTEFWRRWHITLGRWFKEYVYIPLGGNRKGDRRTVQNLFLVWILTGIWHGSGINFLLWSIVIFGIIVIEKAGLKKLLDKSMVLSRVYMLILIPSTWMLFAISKIDDIFFYFRRLFPIEKDSNMVYQVLSGNFMQYIQMYWGYFLLAFLFSTNLPEKIYAKRKNNFIVILGLFFLFWICIYETYNSANNPFLYFKF